MRSFQNCLASSLAILILAPLTAVPNANADTRLLRQPTISESEIAFAHGGDLWVVGRDGGLARRLTATPEVESDPHFSPDGKQIAFTSDRDGVAAVYIVDSQGGIPKRLTWYPADAAVRGWTPDGKRILYRSSRETAPTSYGRLWTVSPDGGPSERLPAPFADDGSYSASGRRIIIAPTSRWDGEWRHYRGGQNRALILLNLESLEEQLLPNNRTVDIQPLWLGSKIYFLSDRNWAMNIWSWDPGSGDLAKLTDFADNDIKWLAGSGETLIFERSGNLYTMELSSGQIDRLSITVRGDFPWASTEWEDVSEQIRSAGLSATGKRAVFESRGEIFTVPAEKGSPRNLTNTSGAADRAPVWSPNSDDLAWFSDDGNGYKLMIADQDGMEEPREIEIGLSKMAWEPTWSPDGTRIAFVDDDVRIRVVELDSGTVTTADTGGVNIERGSMGITWSPDSKWLAYAKTFDNGFRRIVVWSVENGSTHYLTDPMADAISPAWSPDGKHLYLLASTDRALGSGWANTSAIESEATYGAYVILMAADAKSPFEPESDEESDEKEESADEDSSSGDNDETGDETDQQDKPVGDSTESSDKKSEKAENGKSEATTNTSSESGQDVPKSSDDKKSESTEPKAKEKEAEPEVEVKIDLEGIERRILSLPVPVSKYRFTLPGPAGSVFIAESSDGGLTLRKFSFKDREATEFLTGIRTAVLSGDGKKLLYQSDKSWSICDTDNPPSPGKGKLNTTLKFRLDRTAEWEQMFAEAWRYMRDYFYDPKMHGRDWEIVRERYAPLLPFVRHRSDLTYLIDQMNGELSVGHSFVRDGDRPRAEVEASVGLLGADLVADGGGWKMDRIYTFESWNPDLRAPLDRPGLKAEVGHYLVGVNGEELTSEQDPYRLLDGTADNHTTLHLNDKPTFEGSWTVVVEPISSEVNLRRRAWVEDNRRRVETLSDGKLGYVWIPNTGGPGVISFNRYFFAQQHKLGAVIDERFNGGGLLDDYMVDLMTRKLRAAITNEVPEGRPFRLPAGILGPKVLLINEYAGSGGDFFPWVFRQQQAGPLIGNRTWGGLVKSSTHYPLIDGGSLTAPDNAVFDPINKQWIGENTGIAPDIAVRWDAKAAAEDRDPQLERGVEELLKLLEQNPPVEVEVPEFPTPANRPDGE